MLISRLILRFCRVNDRGERRLTTDKGDLIQNNKHYKWVFDNETGEKKGPVVEISGFEVVEAVAAERVLSVARVTAEGCRRVG